MPTEYSHRPNRTDEYLDLLKLDWTAEGPFSYSGRYYQAEDSHSDVRSPRMPVYFGGSSQAAYRVGGKHADVCGGEPLAETAP